MNNLDRNIKPVPQNEISFSLPEIESFNLTNGLKVLLIRKDKLPIVQMNVLFDAGSKYDLPGKKGTANLFSMLADEGAGKYDSLQLSDEFDKLGTHFGIQATEDDIYFTLQTLSENFMRSAELLSSILTEPHLHKSDFERERRKIITRLLQLKDEPDEIADLVFSRILFGESNPYAFPVTGYESDINSVTVENVKNFYSDFINPVKGSIIVVGDVESNELEKRLNTLLSGLMQKKMIYVRHSSPDDKKLKLFIVDKKDAVQSEIRAGHLAGKRNEKDYYSKVLVNMILGGQFSSRINLNLREKNGYTYGANSRFSYLKEGAFFSVSTSVNTSNTSAAIKEIIKELNGIRNGIKIDELNFAKSSMIRKFPSNFETYRQIASNLSAMVIHSLPADYFNNYITRIESVTLEEANDISASSIKPDEMKFVIVGDKNKLLPELQDIFHDAILEVDINGNLTEN